MIALIIKYKPEEGKDKIIEINKSRIGVIVKNTLLNYLESILKYL